MIDNQATCMRLYMSDLDKTALEKDAGKTAVILYIVPRKKLPQGATHAVYQHVPGRTGEQHPIVGFARPYRSPSSTPAYLQDSLDMSEDV
jgi:hypothetical protein